MWVFTVEDELRNGDAFPGVVTDDTQVFTDAKKLKMKVQTFDVILPVPAFQDFQQKLIAERRRSQFTYGFPDGDGECNCTTWLERLALPLLSGSMDEFTNLLGFAEFTESADLVSASSEVPTMKPIRQKKIPATRKLGMLAMQFRGTRDEAERTSIAQEYSQVVAELIDSKRWRSIPPLEDQLPDEWMPVSFFEYWSLSPPPRRGAQGGYLANGSP